ncbi:RND transporter [Maritimibacter sp. UBA3975]|uniref:RND transporter n=1 Tax=Maritimibacter sp. UBA3975 TaxID=1946833 RepID=UPI000C0B9EBA|nr:RND transporter [Maritimibacter sp. UBA3975]MAM60141.1 RND transporter [Maritimibacter sp.]|tara:strand:+ start:41939 stop:42163 length:225 start_codon:yes stop_codon:yes gene_type:complete
MRLLDSIPITTILIFCATIGLAPFTPPHVWEKLGMLFSGTLAAPVDIFDLAMHGLPWLVLVAKLARVAQLRVTA